MSKDTKIICINADSGRLTDAQGALLTDVPRILYAAQPQWDFTIFRAISGVMQPLDLTEATAWRFAADVDLDSATTPIMRTNDQNIDHSGAASGLIKVQLDSYTSGFLRVVDKKDAVGIWCELRGMDGEGYTRYAYRFRANALGSVDPVGGPVPQVTSGLAEKLYVDAKVNAVSGALDAHVEDSTVHVTAEQKSEWSAKSDFSGSYNDLSDKPDLTGFQPLITAEAKLDYSLVSGGPDVSNFATAEDLQTVSAAIPSAVSQLSNDSNFATTGELQAATSGLLANPGGGVSGMFLMRTDEGQTWATPQAGGGGGSYDEIIAQLEAKIQALSAILSGYTTQTMTFTISGTTTTRNMLTSGGVNA